MSRRLRGHCAYYGITGNARALAVFRYTVLQIWRKWLRWRSNKARKAWQTEPETRTTAAAPASD